MNPKIHVLPFALSNEEYAPALDEPCDVDLTTALTILMTPVSLPMMVKAREHEIAEVLEPVIRMLEDSPMGEGYGRVKIQLRVVRASHSLWNLLSAPQRAWLVRDCYTQVGFQASDAFCDADIDLAIGTGLTVCDFLVTRHGSTETMDHQPLELPYTDIRELRLNMGDVYRHGLTFLPRTLLPFRNKIAVMARAALAGEDPVGAYHRFLEESRQHFLDVEYSETMHIKDIFVTEDLAAFAAEEYDPADSAAQDA
jgi:hypothetical protein